jgi:hypothetical protein
MSSSWCKDCGEFIYTSCIHICPPSWQAIRPEYCDPDDESTFYKAFGHDAEGAALELAERRFSDWEYPREIEIWVRKTAADNWQKFEITVESVPSFTASPVDAGTEVAA